MGRIFVKGDYHGNFTGIKEFCHMADTSRDDLLIILGDAALNYYGGSEDFGLKRSLAKLPLTLGLVHGNHEERPYNVPGYKLVDSPFGAGKVWHDDRFSNQFFFDDGEYVINGKSSLVIGGAYSVDKFYRLMNGSKWFSSEQISSEMKAKLLQETAGKYYNYVFSHTCPTNYIPRDMFLSGLNQSEIDHSTEEFLQLIHDQIEYDWWGVGHWHTDRVMDRMNFLFKSYKEIEYGEG